MPERGDMKPPLTMPDVLTWIWIGVTFVFFFIHFSMVFYDANRDAIRGLFH